MTIPKASKEIEEALIQMASVFETVDVIETDSPVDEMSGLYGLPRGYFTEFWGESDTGKSTAALQAVAGAQARGFNCLWVDAENTLSVAYARKLGVDVSKLGVLRGLTAETILEKLLAEVKANRWHVIVLDSIGSLSSRIWFEKEVGDKTVGVQASILTRFVQLSVAYVRQHKTVFIGVNHAREDMNGKLYQMGGKLWTEKKKFSIRFKPKSGPNIIKQGEITVGKLITMKVTKNHVGNTYGKEMDVQLLNDVGFSAEANLLQKAIDKEIIRKDGASYFLGDEKIAYGQGKAREWIALPENQERIKSML